MAGGDGPFEDADLGGFEGEAEAFVGDLEAGFDAAAFLVFGEKFFVGEFGGALAGAGAAGEVKGDAEEDRDAEAGEEGEFGKEAAVLGEGGVGARLRRTRRSAMTTVRSTASSSWRVPSGARRR